MNDKWEGWEILADILIVLGILAVFLYAGYGMIINGAR